jgi:mono/diheme cytochrome c family protein
MARFLEFLVPFLALLGGLVVAASVLERHHAFDRSPGLRALVWTIRLSIGFLLAGVAAASIAYVVSNDKLRRRYDVPLPMIAVPTDAAALARGARFGEVRCTGCHGPDLGGQVLRDRFATGRVVAPNLTRGLGGSGAVYNDMELVRAIRDGIGRDGRALLHMPAAAYYDLADGDVAAVVAWVRGKPPVATQVPPSLIRFWGRMRLAFGADRPDAAWMDHARPRMAPGIEGPTAAWGRYLAATSCAACHDWARTDRRSGAPALAGVAAYAAAPFERLVREGVAADGRTLGPAVPGHRFPAYTADEVAGMYAYLHTLPKGH